MYPAPPEIETRLFTRLLDDFRIAGEPNFWVGINKPGGMMDSFLEGPSFDRDDNLYCVDIPYGRIFRVSPDGEWTLAVDYDGEPNGAGLPALGRRRIGTLARRRRIPQRLGAQCRRERSLHRRHPEQRHLASAPQRRPHGPPGGVAYPDRGGWAPTAWRWTPGAIWPSPTPAPARCGCSTQPASRWRGCAPAPGSRPPTSPTAAPTAKPSTSSNRKPDRS